MKYEGLIRRYRDFLPALSDENIVTLLEGHTPLISVPRLAKALGAPNINLYLKYEGLNPTGSFKDRGMTMAVSKAKEEGAKAIVCASTGNTSASAAAYASRAGLKCLVLIPKGKIALGKLSQAMIHGAKVISVEGNFDHALELVKEVSSKYPIQMVNSLNPFRLEGQKTGAFEIIDDLGDAPDYQFMPVGNAGNITAYWMGYNEFNSSGKSKKKPKMMGFQAEGAAPIVDGAPVPNPKTIATAIRIGNPASWKRAEKARDESDGLIDKVSDQHILEMYQLVAKTEGIFSEPACAAGVAGLQKCIKDGKVSFEKGANVVCIMTGHGLKDPDTALSHEQGPTTIAPTLDALKKHLDF